DLDRRSGMNALAKRSRGRPATRPPCGARPGLQACGGERDDLVMPWNAAERGAMCMADRRTRLAACKRSRGAIAKSPNTASDPVSDGHPTGWVRYREYKLILRPDRFTSHEALHEFSKLVRGAAKKEGVEVTRAVGPDECLLREIVFYDTPHFDLYESAFI